MITMVAIARYLVCFALLVAVNEAVQGPNAAKNPQKQSAATTTSTTTTTQKPKISTVPVVAVNGNNLIYNNATTGNGSVGFNTDFTLTTPSSNSSSKKAVTLTQKSKASDAVAASAAVAAASESLAVDKSSVVGGNSFNYNVTIENGTDAVKAFESPTNRSVDEVPFVVINTNSESNNTAAKTVDGGDNNKTSTSTTNTSTVIVTSTTTTKTIITTTTVVPPITTTTTATGVSKNNNGEPLKVLTDEYCSCDLTFGSCDLNCCCDSECSIGDIKTFTSCSAESSLSRIKMKSILFDSSLFYVIVDNVPSNYFYPEREPIETETRLLAVLRDRNVIDWHDNTLSDHSSHRLNLVYKSLHWMFVYSNRNTNESVSFSLKNSAFDSLCSVDDPVEYLVDKDTSCEVYIRNLTESCKNNSILSFDRFYDDRGFKVSRPLYNHSSKTEKIELVNLKAVLHHCLVAVNGSYNCSVGGQINPAMSTDGTTCHNVVKTVEYVVRHNGTRGVKNLDVFFYYGDLSRATQQRSAVYFTRRFKTKFKWANQSAKSYPLSGKPGYMQGKPVIVKHKQSKPEQVQFLSVPTSDSRRACDPNSRLLVDFNGNVKTVCVFRWNKTESSTNPVDHCQKLQSKINSVLGNYDDLMVSSMGDPNVSKWIPIMVVKPTPSSDQCKNIVNSVSMKVFFSNVGSFDNPQATIHGILVNFSSVHLNGYETDGEKITLEIPIVNSVKFLDLTKAPIREFADPPTYEFRLPEDFFYPFLSDAYRLHSPFFLVLLLIVLNTTFVL